MEVLFDDEDWYIVQRSLNKDTVDLLYYDISSLSAMRFISEYKVAGDAVPKWIILLYFQEMVND